MFYSFILKQNGFFLFSLVIYAKTNVKRLQRFQVFGTARPYSYYYFPRYISARNYYNIVSLFLEPIRRFLNLRFGILKFASAIVSNS